MPLFQFTDKGVDGFPLVSSVVVLLYQLQILSSCAIGGCLLRIPHQVEVHGLQAHSVDTGE